MRTMMYNGKEIPVIEEEDERRWARQRLAQVSEGLSTWAMDVADNDELRARWLLEEFEFVVNRELPDGLQINLETCEPENCIDAEIEDIDGNMAETLEEIAETVEIDRDEWERLLEKVAAQIEKEVEEQKNGGKEAIS